MEQKLAFRLGDAVISEGPACISGSRLRCRSLHKGSCPNHNFQVQESSSECASYSAHSDTRNAWRSAVILLIQLFTDPVDPCTNHLVDCVEHAFSEHRIVGLLVKPNHQRSQLPRNASLLVLY